jgi:hypothetical protein
VINIRFFKSRVAGTPATPCASGCEPKLRVRAKGKIARTSPPARELLNGCTFDGLGDFNAQGRRWLHHVANFRIHGTNRAGELVACLVFG